MTDAVKPAWVVTTQIETTDQDASGQYVPGVRVSFRTAAGATSSVFVPISGYSADAVKALINERAAIMAEVSGLTG